jgi:hypothetical protein
MFCCFPGVGCGSWISRRSTLTHPRIDLGNLEFPEAAHAMSWQILLLDPTVDGVLGHAEVVRNFINGGPVFGGQLKLL